MSAASDWYNDALCQEVGPEMFYPPDDERQACRQVHAYEATRRLCAQCPVWQECRLAGMSERSGMWGGLVPQERRRLRQAATAELPVRDVGWTDPLSHLRQQIEARWNELGSVDLLLQDWPALDHPKMHEF